MILKLMSPEAAEISWEIWDLCLRMSSSTGLMERGSQIKADLNQELSDHNGQEFYEGSMLLSKENLHSAIVMIYNTILKSKMW